MISGIRLNQTSDGDLEVPDCDLCMGSQEVAARTPPCIPLDLCCPIDIAI